MRRRRTSILLTAAVCAAAVLLLLLFPPRAGRAPKGIGKVGMLLTGSMEDRSYGQSQYEALAAVCGEMGLELVCEDRVPSGAPFLERAEALIADGCGILFCGGAPPAPDLTAAHPATWSPDASGTAVVEGLSSYQGREYQARYLTGIVAGSMTRTHQIGYVLSSFTPETIRQLDAFTIGVRLADPEATVHVRHTDDWDDGEKAASETTTLLESYDIDVLAQHLGTVSPLRLADGRGIYTIGSGYDDADLFPETWLTGCVYDWEPSFRERIAERVEGRAVGQRWWEGVRSGQVGLAPLSDLVDGRTRELVEAELGRLMDGSHDVFFGPLTDIYGTERVREDENVSDDQLLHGMYWFVDGVVIG